MTPAATTTDHADLRPSQVNARLERAPDVDDMTAAQMLAELETIAPPLALMEAVVDDLRARRLAIWCAARLLPKDEGRPIFVALAEASQRSEALVIKATQKAFEKRGITPPR
jgi:hypothetical protein